MNSRLVYDDVYVASEKIWNITGTDYQPFAPPAALKETALTPKNYALLLRDYIRLDGTRELLD